MFSSRCRADLTGAPPDLRALVNFGFFGVIARPLFLWLKWTYELVHNWGWAIVIQTLIINLALLPLARLQHEVGAEDAEGGSRRSRPSRKSTRSTACAIRASRR